MAKITLTEATDQCNRRKLAVVVNLETLKFKAVAPDDVASYDFEDDEEGVLYTSDSILYESLKQVPWEN